MSSATTLNKTRMNKTRMDKSITRAAIPLCLAALLSACGGGDDDAPAAGSGGGGSVAAAPLVVSAGTPASLNGTLDKTTAVFESNSSNALMTTYNASDDHCRVGAFAVLSSNGTRYTLEISFSKSSKAVGIVKFGTDSPLAQLARSVAPVAGVTVDVANRRIGFANVLVGGAPSTNSVTLNGSLEYPSNVDAANRAACG
jgi:hypothetical protein